MTLIMQHERPVEVCPRCGGDGRYFVTPPGFNPFEVSIFQFAKVMERRECDCRSMPGPGNEQALLAEALRSPWIKDRWPEDGAEAEDAIHDLRRALSLALQCSMPVAGIELPAIDTLAQIIRRVDGSNTLGAGALAEAIVAEAGASARLDGTTFTVDPEAEEIADG